MSDFDAIVLVSFGGPEGPDDVVPFLKNVTKGRNIPDHRLTEVADHYRQFGGVSPINEQCRRIRGALAADLQAHGHDLPVYWGNRNWTPYLTDTVREMAADGVRNALALVTSAYSSYSGCRQYIDDIEAARESVGSSAPLIEKIRPYFDHPGFIEPFRRATLEAVQRLDGSGPTPPLVFTAHSIPLAMADASDYRQQLLSVAQLVAEAVPGTPRWDLVWQSRSGPPSVPWLEPDVNGHLRHLAAESYTEAVVIPIGFVSDHMEVVWDLDHEARSTAAQLGLRIERATTPGTRPEADFVTMARQLIEERVHGHERLELSDLSSRPAPCHPGCCVPPSSTTV